MDIFSHALWGGAAGKMINHTKKQRVVNPYLTAFFGAFPDLFAFTPLFTWMIFQSLFGDPNLAHFGPPEDNGAPFTRSPLFLITPVLYSLSHSLVVFIFVALIIKYIFKKPIWVLIGWPLHILCDIPTHTSQFYPTPFLWPLSDYHFDGISWATPWFMIVNYSAIILTYIILAIMRKQKNTT